MHRALALLGLGLAACSSGGVPAPAAARDAAPPTGRDAEVPDAGDDLPADDGGVVAAVDPAERLRAGRALAQKLKWADALAALQQAASRGDPDALAELAFTAVLAGDARAAQFAANRALADKQLSDARRATAYYHLARAAELEGDLAAARDGYQRSLALVKSPSVQDHLDKLTPRRATPAPPPAPCNTPAPVAALCGCLAAAVDPTAEPHCVESHKHGGDAWAITVVTRDRAPTFLAVAPAPGQALALAQLGATPSTVPDAELTITRWNVLRGPGGAPVVRIDARTSARDPGGKLRTLGEEAMVCEAGATPRCLAVFPTFEKVGTPAVARRLDLALEASDARGVAQLTIVEGPATPADLLGVHRLW